MRILLLFVLLAQAKPAAPAGADDEKALPIKMVPQDSLTVFQAQLLGELDRPVGEGVTVGAVHMPAKVTTRAPWSSTSRATASPARSRRRRSSPSPCRARAKSPSR